MFKKFAAIGLSTIFITGCVSPAESQVLKVNTAIALSYTKTTPLLVHIAQTEKISMHNMTITANREKVSLAIKSLKKYVGKTWYVFSGNTPSGWDCSGLTMWFYSQLGFDLEHRASKQESAGELVIDAMPGDLVVFKYKGYKSAYHVGIYIGNGKMIHAPRKGEVTRIEDVNQFGGNYSNIYYYRMLQLS